MAKIKDLRAITPRTNGTRKLSAIKNIARHYSATKTGNWASFWRHWNGKLGWGTGGYHEIILPDGTVELCYDPEEITNGVGGQNSYIYNICLVSDGTFTDAQETAWEERAKYWMKRLGLPVSAVKGHNEFPNQSTSCPGISMNLVRDRLSNSSTSTSSRRYLMIGDAGEDVRSYQEKLKRLGYKIDVDGSFGNGMLATVKQFQKDNNLEIDGFLGKVSQTKINELINNKKGELTMSQYEELRKEIENLKNQLNSERSVGESYKKDWEWAKSKEFLNGSNPARYVTREQLSAVLHRYNNSNDLSPTTKKDLKELFENLYEDELFLENHADKIDLMPEYEIINKLASVLNRFYKDYRKEE